MSHTPERLREALERALDCLRPWTPEPQACRAGQGRDKSGTF